MTTFQTNHTLIAAFVNQNIIEGKNPRDSLSFNRNKLYSYESHMATITVDKVLFINADLISYSNTTSAHISSLRGFWDNSQIFIMPLDKQPLQVLEWYWESIEKLIPKYLRSITKKEIYKSDIHELISKAEAYVDYMQLDRSSEEYMYKTEITRQLFEHQIL